MSDPYILKDRMTLQCKQDMKVNALHYTVDVNLSFIIN